MIDTLDRIHDNALAGNIICECGDADIDLVLLSDCILLKCGRCGGSKRYRRQNSDLKDMLAMNQILLAKDTYKYREGLLPGSRETSSGNNRPVCSAKNRSDALFIVVMIDNTVFRVL